MCKMLSFRPCIILPSLVLYAKLARGSEDDEFDYIIVGAGSAGSILANRLSAKHRVLLLEKGGTPSIITNVPALGPATYTTSNGEVYQTERQPGFGLGLKNQRVSWVHGKGLGGSSLINNMVYLRGVREDYDRWAAAGNPGWSYNEVVESFKTFENTHLPIINGSLRGIGGELDVTEVPYRSKITPAFVEGCKQTGMKYLEDYNGGVQMGVGYLQANLRDGSRCHSEKAFLHDIRDRKTLVIKTNTLVTKLIIDKGSKIVQSVQYKDKGQIKYANVTKEVILSAGSMGSPQILMLSGIGPKKHLQELGIDVVQDLPVGQVMYDHVGFLGLLFKLNESVSPMFSDLLNPINWGEYLLQGQGPITVPNFIVEGMAFVKTDVSNETLPIPDVEIIFLSGSLSTVYGLSLKESYRITDESYDVIWKPLEGKHIWSIGIYGYYPRSRGYMKLNSANSTDPPKLYANYFSDPENKDMKTLIAAIRIAQKIAKAPALAKYGSEMSLNAVPGCRSEVVDSDAFWECQIRHLPAPFLHHMGTCKMGPKDDPEAAVDNELRVYGLRNLRVSDAGIIPRALAAHTHIPATLVGQKAAEFILGKIV